MKLHHLQLEMRLEQSLSRRLTWLLSRVLLSLLAVVWVSVSYHVVFSRELRIRERDQDGRIEGSVFYTLISEVVFITSAIFTQTNPMTMWKETKQGYELQ